MLIQLPTFNRTILELKYIRIEHAAIYIVSFNRTILELK